MKTIFHSSKSGRLFEGWRNPLFTRLLVLAASALLWSGVNASASDPVGLYALIDKVQFEPSEQKPERIVLWGAFSVAQGERGQAYKSPEKGYVYFALPEKKAEVALKEWSDLKSVAGKGEVIGLSTRWGEPVKVRKESEPRKDPDEYRTGFGLVRMERKGTEYPPVKALLTRSAKKPAKS